MEEIKNTIKGKEEQVKKHSADFGLRILAVVCAVIIWFALSITQYPTISKTINNVHVTFPTDGTVAAEKGLSALNLNDIKDLTVDVEIKGMNYEIGGYTADDLIASVNLDNVTKEGTYILDIDVKSTHSTDRCTVVSVNPPSVSVNFDRITEKTVALSTEAPLISAVEGYTLKGTAVSPAEVTVQGAAKDLENLSKAVVQVAKSEKINKDTTIATDKIIFYDADDNVLESSKFTIKENSNFNVKFIVFKKKTANLKVEISNCPKDFDVSSLPLKMSVDKISVISPNLDSEDTETITVSTIPLSTINFDKIFEFKIPIMSGEINQTGTDSVSVSVDKSGYASKTFTITSDRISIKNAPMGRNTSIETQKLSNVVICGPESVVSKLSDSDIYAEVDLSDVIDTGSYSREALVYAKGHNNVWCYGKNDIQVVVGNDNE